MTFRLEDLTPDQMSRAERLASLPPEQRAELQVRLSQSHREALKWNWEFWGRPDQFVPEDCSIYFRSAGRGSGKTREGSEWVRKKGPRHREGLLIGANPRDVRDLMIEGRSGVVTISPPWERPQYEPTKLLLRWPNGAIAHVRSAEDPAGIRGLSVEWIWCFPAGTLVTTDLGQVPIEQVRAGDRVLTRKGFKRVEKSLSRMATEMATLTHSAGVLRATPEHPIWTTRGWVPMRDLVPGDNIATCANSSTGTGSGGTSTRRIATTATAAASSTTGRSTSPSTALCPPGCTSITATRTESTTTSATSKPSAPPTILPITQSAGSVRHLPLLEAVGSLDHGNEPRPGATPVSSAASRPLCGRTVRIPTPAAARTSADGFPRSESFAVSDARRHASLPSVGAPAPARVKLAIANSRGHLSCNAPSVASASLPVRPDTAPPRLVLARVERISHGNTDERVYDLKVEGAHEFYADGVLVHNCDEIVKWRFLQETWDQSRLALREGVHPQTVVTTTPMPLPLIKKLLKGGRGILVREPVSTYRNFANLSPDYLRELLEMYEGTRLGDQELHAMVLEDTKGAQWTQEMIEGARWTGGYIHSPGGIPLPDTFLRSKVVGVDPSGTAGGDECGIVVVGTDGRRPPCGFVLDDRSMKGSPDEWSRAVVKAYFDYDCDAVVAEVNFGADMVAKMIRDVPAENGYPSGETVRVEPVRAGRGQSKYVRNVPIVGLYEQNLRGFRRIYHFGVLKELEQEQTTWVAKEAADGVEIFASKWSPGRIDASTWGASYLLIINRRMQARTSSDLLTSSTIG